MRIIFIQLLLSLMFFSVNAQDWNWAKHFGGISSEALSSMEISEDGVLTLAGSYSESVDFGIVNLDAIQGSDAFLLKLDDQGEVQWAVSAGSTSNDVSLDVAVDSEGNTIWLGQYWITAFLEEDTIVSGTNSKAYFVAKYDPAGNLIWVESINGSATKVVNDLLVDEANDIYLTGYFNDSIYFGDIVLTTTHESDAFVAKISNEGTAIWGKAYGDFGAVMPQRIAQTSTGDLVIAGHFNGGLTFGTDTLVSVVTDLDIFVAAVDSNGGSRWGKIGKGVFENLLNAMVLDEADNIYVAGNFVGVLRIEEEEILTPGFVDNLYLIKLDANGDLTWARSINQEEFNDPSFAFDLAIKDDLIMMVGQFVDDLIIDDLILDGDGDAKGFIAGFDKEEGIVKQLSEISGISLTSGTQIVVDKHGLVHVGGVYFETAFFDDFMLPATGDTDFFVAQATDLFTDVITVFDKGKNILVYPNPGREYLYLEGTDLQFELTIFDLYGRQIFQVENENQLNIQSLVAGKYILRYQSLDSVQIISFIKN